MAGETFDAGTVEARADLDRTPAQNSIKQLKKELRELSRQTATPKVGLNVREFNRKMAGVSKTLTRFNGRRVSAKVDLNPAAFRAKLAKVNQQLSALDRRTATAKVNVRTGDFATKMRMVNAALNRLERRTVTVRIRGDVATFHRKLLAARRALDGIDKRRAVATLDVNVRIFNRKLLLANRALTRFGQRRATATLDARLAPVNRKLLLANRALTRFGTRTATATVDVRTAGFTNKMRGVNRSLTEFSTNTAVAASHAGRGLSRMFSHTALVAAAIPLVLAAIPPAIGLIGTALLGIPGLLAAIGSAAGVVALGVDGIKRAAQIAKPAVDNLKKAMSDIFAEEMKQGFRTIANVILPGLQSSMGTIAYSTSAAFNEMIRFLSTDPAMRAMNRVLDNTGGFIRAIIPFLRDFTAGFLVLADVGTRALNTFAIKLNGFGAAWRAMVTRLANTGILERAFNALGRTVEIALHGILRLAEQGAIFMATVGPQFNRFFKLLVDSFIQLMPFMTSVARLVMAIATPIIQALVPALNSLRPILDAITWFFTKFQTQITIGLQVLLPMIAAFWGLKTALRGVGALIGGIGSAAMTASGFMGFFGRNSRNAGRSARMMGRSTRLADVAMTAFSAASLLGSRRVRGVGGAARGATPGLFAFGRGASGAGTAARGAGLATGGWRAALGGVARVIPGVGAALAGITAGIGIYKYETWRTKDANASLSQTLHGLHAEVLKTAGAQMQHRGSMLNVEGAQRSLNAAVKQYGKGSFEARMATFQFDTAVMAAARSIHDMKLSSKDTAQRLVDLAVKAGDRVPPQLQKMIGKLDITSLEAAGAKVKIDRFGTAIAHLPNGKTVRIGEKGAFKARISTDKFGTAIAILPNGKRVQISEHGAGHARIMTDRFGKAVIKLPDGRTIPVHQKGARPARKYVNEFGTAIIELPNGKKIPISQTGAEKATRKVNRLAEAFWAVVDAVGAAWKAIKNFDAEAPQVKGRGQHAGGAHGARSHLFGRARGGIGIAAYAAGGLRPMGASRAQVVPPRQPRLIGDRMKGDEAFIPINNSKRSMDILAETANRMGQAVAPASGMAAGGRLSRGGQGQGEAQGLGDTQSVKQLTAALGKLQTQLSATKATMGQSSAATAHYRQVTVPTAASARMLATTGLQAVATSGRAATMVTRQFGATLPTLTTSTRSAQTATTGLSTASRSLLTLGLRPTTAEIAARTVPLGLNPLRLAEDRASLAARRLQLAQMLMRTTGLVPMTTEIAARTVPLGLNPLRLAEDRARLAADRLRLAQTLARTTGLVPMTTEIAGRTIPLGLNPLQAGQDRARLAADRLRTAQLLMRTVGLAPVTTEVAGRLVPLGLNPLRTAEDRARVAANLLRTSQVGLRAVGLAPVGSEIIGRTVPLALNPMRAAEDRARIGADLLRARSIALRGQGLAPVTTEIQGRTVPLGLNPMRAAEDRARVGSDLLRNRSIALRTQGLLPLTPEMRARTVPALNATRAAEDRTRGGANLLRNRSIALRTQGLSPITPEIRGRTVPAFQVMERHAGTFAPNAIRRLRDQFPPLRGENAATSNSIRAEWSSTSGHIGRMAHQINGHFGFLETAVRRVGRTFRDEAEGIRVNWGAIRRYAHDPVSWVVREVWNKGIREIWNKTADVFGQDPLPRIGMKTGGEVPGRGKGDKVPRMLEPGEIVMSNKAVKQHGRKNLLAMNDGKAAIPRGTQLAMRDEDPGLLPSLDAWERANYRGGSQTLQGLSSKGVWLHDDTGVGRQVADNWSRALGIPFHMGAGPTQAILNAYRSSASKLGVSYGNLANVNMRTAGGQVLSTAMHEMGHVLGLPHSDDRSSLMYPSLTGRTTPTAADVAALKALYPAGTFTGGSSLGPGRPPGSPGARVVGAFDPNYRPAPIDRSPAKVDNVPALPGFGPVGGGAKSGATLAGIVRQMFPGATISDTYRPGANDFHGRGNAVDFHDGTQGSARMAAWAARLVREWGAKSTEIIHNPSGSVKNGRVVPPTFWGPGTWASHRNHIHWAMAGVSGGAEGGGGTMPMFDPRAAQAMADLEKLKKQIRPRVEGFFGRRGKDLAWPDVVTRAPEKAIETIIGGIKPLASFTSGGGNVQANVALGKRMAAAMGWTGAQWQALLNLFHHESNWDHHATNPTSGAYGIPQALPAGKMASAGPDWRTNPATQLRWGLSYIKRRYGSPIGAWSAWQSRSPHWYDAAASVLPPGDTLVHNGTGHGEYVVNPKRIDPADLFDFESVFTQVGQGGGALIGSLTVQTPQGASAKDVIDEALFQVRHHQKGRR